ncbi:MAG TPA: phosphatidate cytidylyltransferase [Elusimicrobia bacterium]|nr:phosphatidate cytidylyltransferase [Elusimicrobiota bacterium]
MLLPRVLTALFGIPVVLLLIRAGGPAYAVFVFTIIALSLYEYATLMKLGSKPVQAPMLYLFGLLLPAALYFDHYSAAQLGGDNFTGFFIALTVIGVMTYELFSPVKYLERIGLTLLGIFMISWCLFHLVAIRGLRSEGLALTLLLIITVWIMDTAAYFLGKSFGRRQLSSISPKKTWEGAVAGFAAAILTAWGISRLTGGAVTPLFAIGAGVLIGIFGQISDIAESMLKRAVGAKDSSNLLPGHGGILDRFDSYIFLAPVIYYYAVFAR